MIPSRRINKILLCASFTPPVNAGGGKNAYHFGTFLSKKGCQVTLLSLNRKGKEKSHDRSNGMNIIRLLYFNHNIFTKFLSLVIILPGYLWYVLRHPVVFIYGGNLLGFEAIIFFCWVFRKKVVFRSTMYREDDLETLILKRPLGNLRKWIFKKVSFYFSLSPAFTRSWMVQIGDTEKVFESVQGVDANIFSPGSPQISMAMRAKLDLPSDKLILITVGYVLKRKGFYDIIHTLAELGIPYLYLVVGNFRVSRDHYLFKYREEMETLYQLGTQKLGGNIKFVGPQENVQEYLQASDIFLLCSRREGFPNALLEAMSSGLPSIIRNLPDHYDFIAKDGKNIILFENPKELASKLTDIMDEPVFRKSLGTEARKSIMEQGSFEKLWTRIQAKLIDS